MKKVLVVLSSVLVVLLTACGTNETPTDYLEADLLNTSAFLELLDGAGFDFEMREENECGRMFNLVRISCLSLDSEIFYAENITIYEFATIEDVAWYSTGIGLGGENFGYPATEYIVFLQFGSIPHWFKTDLIIVFYLGTDSQVIDFLTDLLGSPFAGAGVGTSYFPSPTLSEESINQMKTLFQGNSPENRFVIPMGMSFEETVNAVGWEEGVTLASTLYGLSSDGLLIGRIDVLLNARIENDEQVFDDRFSFSFGMNGLYVYFEDEDLAAYYIGLSEAAAAYWEDFEPWTICFEAYHESELGGYRPIVGTWNELWEDPEGIAYTDSQRTFNEDGTGFITGFGEIIGNFLWSVNEDRLTITRHSTNFSGPSPEQTTQYRFTIENDFKSFTRIDCIDRGWEPHYFHFERVN